MIKESTTYDFKCELAYFDEHREEWCKNHTGQFVVIKDTILGGFWDTANDALKVGYDKFGLEPFLLKEVRLVDEILFFPSPLSVEVLDEYPDYSRAGGDTICQLCDKVYYDHPQHEKFRFLNVLCNGDVVKL